MVNLPSLSVDAPMTGSPEAGAWHWVQVGLPVGMASIILAAILVSPFSLYRFDPGYALEVAAAFPGKFGLVKPVDTANAAVADILADWAATRGAVRIRIIREQAPDEPVSRIARAFVQEQPGQRPLRGCVTAQARPG